MKSILKGFLVLAAVLTLTVSAGAEEAATYETKSENISFDYQENTFSITDTTAQTAGTELTVMLVKGDYSDPDTSLANITASDVYYVGQASSTSETSYSALFNTLGVKYDDGEFTPDVYTMITSGYGMTATRTKLFVGNAVNSDGANTSNLPAAIEGNDNVSYGTVTQTIRIDEDATDGTCIFVSVGKVQLNGSASTDKIGFVVQKQEANGNVMKSYKSLADLKVSGFENIASWNGSLSLGIQLNDVAENTGIVAIPYVDSSVSAQ